MGKTYRPLIIGYHGCDKEKGEAALAGEEIPPSNSKYDWLGNGIYFWEGDQHRALEWAQMLKKREKIKNPFVFGAILDLENCLDLTQRETIPLMKEAYESLKEILVKAKKPLPQNSCPKGLVEPDKLWRALDCAVIQQLHESLPKRFDSVRGLFPEGKPIYPGSAFKELSHTQIAIINPKRIVGVFRVKQGP